MENKANDRRMENSIGESNLGSTRIKVVLIDKDHHPIASGSHDWEKSSREIIYGLIH